jgi:hypothetical protein
LGCGGHFAVIVTWIFYRYVAPKRWREWSRAGSLKKTLDVQSAVKNNQPWAPHLVEMDDSRKFFRIRAP